MNLISDDIRDFIEILLLSIIAISILNISICCKNKSNNFKYDVNGDGKINSSDYIAIKKYIMKGK